MLTFPGRGEFYGLVHGQPQEGRTRYLAEGVGAVVVTDHGPSGTSNWINGLSHGNRPNPWYMGEAVEAFSFAPECRDVLVIGFGAGTFVETALNVNEVEHLTLVEINASVVENFSKIREFKQLLTDPRVSLVIDDGRRFLLRTDHTYDMILIDPMRTTASYSNNLYSREFFELVKRRLKPRGLFLAWTDDFWVFPHTLAGVFPKLRMYGFSEETGFFWPQTSRLWRTTSGRRRFSQSTRLPCGRRCGKTTTTWATSRTSARTRRAVPRAATGSP